MAKLGGLINGQNVTFDTHQAGDGQNIHWRNVHLEKRVHNRGGKARFPLLGSEEPSNSGMNDNDFIRVTREVKKALKKNEQLLEELAKTIVTQLKRFSSGSATSNDAKVAAKKFAKYFDLDAKFLRIVEEYAEDKLSSVSTIHFDPIKRRLHEIVQTKDSIIIQKPGRYNSLRRIYPNDT